MLLNWLRRVMKGKGRNDCLPFVGNRLDIEDVKDFVYEWNIKYPLDKWWREKHKVAFNSPEHRAVSFISIRVEWEEDKVMDEITISSSYKLNSGDFIKENSSYGKELTEQERLERFKKESESIDLSQYDD